MKRVEKYLISTVIKAIAGIVVLLMGLQFFVLFVGQLPSIGHGDFTIYQAILYVLLQVPYQIYLFFPIACLLGALLGLGTLANHSELIVLRASGMSLFQIIVAVLKAALLLIFLVTLLGETLVPKWVRHAEDKKALLLSGGQALQTSNGLWLRQDRHFINVAKVISPTELATIYDYEFDAKHHLSRALYAKRARYTKDHWQLYEVQSSILTAHKIRVDNHDNQRWSVQPDKALFSLVKRVPEQMSLPKLYRYIQLRKHSCLNTLAAELSFWSRIIQPLSTCVMMVLAIPFIFGSLRHVTMGARFLVGCCVGFSFHMLNQMFVPMSQIYQLSPIASTLLPTLLFAVFAGILIRFSSR